MDDRKSDTYESEDPEVEGEPLTNAFSSKPLQSTSKKIHSLRDARTGLIVNSAPYPSSWKVISKPYYTMDQKIPSFLIEIQGPNHLMTFNTPTKFFASYQNPQMAQIMNQYGYGNMTRNIVSNEQLFKEEVDERMKNSGFSFVKQRNMPKEESFLRQRMQAKGFGQADLEYTASEWKNDKGQKALARIIKIAMHQTLAGSENMMIWFYNTDYIFVDEDHFEDTLNELLTSSMKIEDNPQWEQYMQQLKQQRAYENQQRMQIAGQQHQQRMNAQTAAFNAHQEKMKGIWAAQDANHAAFMNRNFGVGSDTSQKQFINMINEQETVYNPLTGNNYQVDAGSTEYWMDSEGNYIKNEDLFYTPNGDINLNDREWVKVKGAY